MRMWRGSLRYARTPEPETPYQRAGQVWDERIGSARSQARSWRWMAFGSLALAAGMAGAFVRQSMQGHITPYVVEVDATGEARAVAPLTTPYRPTDPQIAWHLARFIVQIRSRSLDPVLMRENWLSSYDFVTPRGGRFLTDYARAQDPFAKIGETTVSVQVTSVVRASDVSFQVKWTETLFERGNRVATTRWTAILATRIRTPRSSDVLRKNPLGLYVDAIDWNRELESEPPLIPSAASDREGTLVSPQAPVNAPIPGNSSTSFAPAIERQPS